jgi:hypothetical protein
MRLIALSRLRFLPILLIAGNQAWAQEPGSAASGPRSRGGSEFTFEWDYSCPSRTSCSFSCPGQGGASHVTKLTIYLGTIPVGTLRNIPAVLYDFSTVEIPSSKGFIVSTGLGTLSCQVNGMTLDYSGPAKNSFAPGPSETK